MSDINIQTEFVDYYGQICRTISEDKRAYEVMGELTKLFHVPISVPSRGLQGFSIPVRLADGNPSAAVDMTNDIFLKAGITTIRAVMEDIPVRANGTGGGKRIGLHFHFAQVDDVLAQIKQAASKPETNVSLNRAFGAAWQGSSEERQQMAQTGSHTCRKAERPGQFGEINLASMQARKLRDTQPQYQ